MGVTFMPVCQPQFTIFHHPAIVLSKNTSRCYQTLVQPSAQTATRHAPAPGDGNQNTLEHPFCRHNASSRKATRLPVLSCLTYHAISSVCTCFHDATSLNSFCYDVYIFVVIVVKHPTIVFNGIKEQVAIQEQHTVFICPLGVVKNFTKFRSFQPEVQ